MKRLTGTLALSAAALLGSATHAVAVTVSVDVTGSVAEMEREVTYYSNGWRRTRTDTYSQMAAYYFSASAGSLELSVPSYSSGWQTFDPYVYLFEDDGDFSEDGLIAFNDDTPYSWALDSYLSTTVPGGNYIALVGQYTNRSLFNGGSVLNPPSDASYIDYVAGAVGGTAYQDTESWNTLPQNGTVEASYNFEMTITGEDLVVAGVSPVPLPASAPLLLAALMIPAGLRKLRRKPEAMA
ncbi:DVUA0089 family protein [Celeribacter sp.]|uniref:DVUA0089 family protein n=1 Tax=Celeribacter sp. TaxID=1890673 RepID=UPI003A94F79B